MDACFNGEDAVYYGNSSYYDVIVLDRMLPLVDGLTVLQSKVKQFLNLLILY